MSKTETIVKTYKYSSPGCLKTLFTLGIAAGFVDQTKPEQKFAKDAALMAKSGWAVAAQSVVGGGYGAATSEIVVTYTRTS